jgi:hypothetical protein
MHATDCTSCEHIRIDELMNVFAISPMHETSKM